MVLVVAIGGLAVANYLQFDPEDVRRELEGKLADYKQIPEADVLKRDVFLHGLLNEPLYQAHAKARYREVERIHGRVHEAADLEVEAKKAVLPFLARCRDLPKLPAGDVRRLYDESRSLLVNYGATQQAAPIRETQGRLKDVLDRLDKIEPKDFIELQKAVRKASDGGRFAEAADLIAAFRQRPGSGDYARQVRDLEEMVARQSAAAVRPR